MCTALAHLTYYCSPRQYVSSQEGQRIIGDSHPHVVMLFSDIVGFSSLAVTLPPVEVFLLVCMSAAGSYVSH